MRGHGNTKPLCGTPELELCGVRMNNAFAFKGREAPWRSENASEETVLIDTRVIIIFQRATESGLDVQNKLNRFRAGEDVEDVHAGPPGTVDKIKVFHFVDPEGKWWSDDID